MKPRSQSFLRYPLNLIFDSPANIRVLRSLARHGGVLSATTLTGFAKLTKPSVLSALRQLVEAGMVEALGADRQQLYRFDASNRLGAALNTLFAVESERYREVMDAVRTSAEKAGAKAAWLYGSTARDEDGPGSDVDIAAACPPTKVSEVVAAMRDRLSDAERHLGFHASVIGVDAGEVERLERERDPWWLGIKRDAVAVMGPAPESFSDSARRNRRRAS